MTDDALRLAREITELLDVPESSLEMRLSRAVLAQHAEIEKLQNAYKAFEEQRDAANRLRAGLREALDGWDRSVFVPPPYAPAAPSSITGEQKAFTVMIDAAAPYRTKARIAELRRLLEGK